MRSARAFREVLLGEDVVRAITHQIVQPGTVATVQHPKMLTPSTHLSRHASHHTQLNTFRRYYQNMTPAERASAVAFALKNCALEAMAPSEATMRAAAEYERNVIDVSQLIDRANEDAASEIFARTVLLAERGWPMSCDLDELRAIHRGLFAGVFDDAGKLRTSNTARKPTSDKQRARDPEAFFPAALIETGAHNIALELSDKRNLINYDRVDFVKQLAHIYDELGYLHPFKGGNAMTLRVFASRLSHDAGWDLDWGPVTRDEYREAKRRAYHGDVSSFERMFDTICRPANPTRVFLIAGWNQGPAH